MYPSTAIAEPAENVIAGGDEMPRLAPLPFPARRMAKLKVRYDAAVLLMKAKMASGCDSDTVSELGGGGVAEAQRRRPFTT